MSLTDAAGTEWLPETPREAVGPVVEEKVILGERGRVSAPSDFPREFRILRPGAPDLLLDNPAVVKAFERDEYMPYWADLWPAARMLAKAILHADWPTGLEVMEIGCGLGLPGIAALAKGLKVTFSDYDATALHFAALNAKLNGFSEFRLLRLDWRRPPDVQFPLLIGSDLLYEERNVAPVVGLLEQMLLPDGLCLLTDQDRKPAPLLRQTLSELGFEFTTEMMRAGEPGLRVKGTLYRIRKGDKRFRQAGKERQSS